MSKDKKKDKKSKGKKNQGGAYKGVKSIVGSKPLLYSLLGAGVGLAIGATLGKETRRAIADKLTGGTGDQGSPTGTSGEGI
ncbi:hypothetical protein [Rufibacter psychrotolerans]|uniref:hypothetical protein n=1 Tax=Rufibacter psychrotolerans TaxID=2812556 RepID=UPI0019680246|nr:hypothetical protein [Rufibacter sp. SYSU D00308]